MAVITETTRNTSIFDRPGENPVTRFGYQIWLAASDGVAVDARLVHGKALLTWSARGATALSVITVSAATAFDPVAADWIAHSVVPTITGLTAAGDSEDELPAYLRWTTGAGHSGVVNIVSSAPLRFTNDAGVVQVSTVLADFSMAADRVYSLDVTYAFTRTDYQMLTVAATNDLLTSKRVGPDGRCFIDCSIVANTASTSVLTITNTAIEGISASQMVNVTITAGGGATFSPVSQDIRLPADALGGTSFNLTKLFHNPDNVALTYSVVNSDSTAGIITGRSAIGGYRVTAVPTSSQTSRVTATAVDTSLALTPQVKTVTIEPPIVNRFAVTSFGIQHIIDQYSTNPLNLLSIVTATAGETVTFALAPLGSTGIVSATITGSTLAVTGVANGIETVWIEITSSRGRTVEWPLQYFVHLAGDQVRPNIIKTFENIIFASGDLVARSFDLENYFDATDTLSYIVAVINGDTAAITIATSGSTLTLTATGAASAGATLELAIRATNFENESTFQNFLVRFI